MLLPRRRAVRRRAGLLPFAAAALLLVASPCVSAPAPTPAVSAKGAGVGGAPRLLGTVDGALHAVDAAGRRMWSFDAGQPLVSAAGRHAAAPGASSEQAGGAGGPGAGLGEDGDYGSFWGVQSLVPGLDGSLFIPARGGGFQKLQVRVQDLVEESPTLLAGAEGEGVLIGERETELFALDARSGGLRYFVGGRGRGTGQGAAAPPGSSEEGELGSELARWTSLAASDERALLDDDNALLLARTRYTVRAVDAASGKQRWNVSVGIWKTLRGAADVRSGGGVAAGMISDGEGADGIAPPLARLSDGSVVAAAKRGAGGVVELAALDGAPHGVVVASTGLDGMPFEVLPGVAPGVAGGDEGGGDGGLALVGRHAGSLFVTPALPPGMIPQPPHLNAPPTAVATLPAGGSESTALVAVPVLDTTADVAECAPQEPPDPLSTPQPTRQHKPWIVNFARRLYLAIESQPVIFFTMIVMIVVCVMLAIVAAGLMLYSAGIDRTFTRFQKRLSDQQMEERRQRLDEAIRLDAIDAKRKKAASEEKARRRKENRKAKAAARAAAEGRTMLAEQRAEAERKGRQASRRGRVNEATTSSAVTGGSARTDSGAVVVGQLTVGPAVLGHGSCGTIVYDGTMAGGRRVAVKRMLGQFYEAARAEIETLILSDSHENVVSCYAMEQDNDFVYLALERCPMTLADLVEVVMGRSSSGMRGGAGGGAEVTSAPADGTNSLLSSPLYERASSGPNTGDNSSAGLPPGLASARRPQHEMRGEKRGQSEAGRAAAVVPTEANLMLARDVVEGMFHLHEKRVIHRDIKPSNVLVTAEGRAKLSDMGIARRLTADASSFDATTAARAAGTQGWRAPELLESDNSNPRLTRAVDVFALGCVLHFLLTGGEHPFGGRFSRDANIVKGIADLSKVAHMPEAVHLLRQMLSHDPKGRPDMASVRRHPLLWTPAEQLAFLCAASDHVDGLKAGSPEQRALERALERALGSALRGGWDKHVDAQMLAEAERWRRYNHASPRDLLRFIRNRVHHFDELDDRAKGVLGGRGGAGVLRYFRQRFPSLVLDVYAFAAGEAMRSEAAAKRYAQWIGPSQ